MAFLPLAPVARVLDDAGMTTTPPPTQVLLFDGYDDLDAVGPLEVLSGAGFSVRPVRPPGHSTSVHSAHGLTVTVGDELDASAGLVVVPGGGWIDRSATGVRAQSATALPAQLATLQAAGAIIASVCTGAMLLGTAGLLTGRAATTNRGALDDLEAIGAIVRRDARVVDDGEIVTCGGPSAGLDLAIHLVERFRGPGAATAAAGAIDYTVAGPIVVTAAPAVSAARAGV